MKLAELIPVGVSSDDAYAEALLLQSENLDPRKTELEIYWVGVFQLKTGLGDPKYPNLTTLVKACLCLSHGNASVERGFSESGRTLTFENTAMSLQTLNSRLYVCQRCSEAMSHEPDLNYNKTKVNEDGSDGTSVVSRIFGQ